MSSSKAPRHPRGTPLRALALSLNFAIIALPMEEFLLSTADLAEHAQRVARRRYSVKTILEWKKQGYFTGLVEPSKVGGPGRGVSWQWPAAARERVTEIVALKAKGFDATKLAEHFKRKSAPKGADADEG